MTETAKKVASKTGTAKATPAAAKKPAKASATPAKGKGKGKANEASTAPQTAPQTPAPEQQTPAPEQAPKFQAPANIDQQEAVMAPNFISESKHQAMGLNSPLARKEVIGKFADLAESVGITVVTNEGIHIEDDRKAERRGSSPDRRQADRRDEHETENATPEVLASNEAPEVDPQMEELKRQHAELSRQLEAAGVLKPQKQGRAPREQRNGISRPGPDTTIGKIWAEADRLSAGGEVISSRHLLDSPNLQGVELNTVRTQYSRWRAFNGITERPNRSQKQAKPQQFERLTDDQFAALAELDSKGLLPESAAAHLQNEKALRDPSNKPRDAAH